jgi:predicted PolB exonuclease-like 3'-5' exonuclease
VRAIGWWSEFNFGDSQNNPTVYLWGKRSDELPEFCLGYQSERDMLASFWEIVRTTSFPLIGFNSNAFDLPILFWRSMMLGVPTSLGKPFNRYDSDFVDLYDVLTFRNPRISSMAGLGLKSVARMLGIPNDLPDVDGSQVKDMSDEDLVKYLTSDVEITRALYYRMEEVYFPGQPKGEAF